MKLHEIQRELISDPIELIGKTVSVRKNSSYVDRIINLQDEIGGMIYIDTLQGDLSTDKIISKVVDGEIEYTIADNNLAEINASYHPQLDVSTEVSFSQRIAWAVRKNSPQLLDTLNHWIERTKDNVEYYVIYNKYFKNKRSYAKRVKSDFFSDNSNKISVYDEIIKKNSEKINWDWRLVSSVVYQESQFDPNAKSWVSAKGLMQLMPETAEALGVTDRSDPAQSIQGGTKYLQQLYSEWENVPDSIQRIKFALASYNCGLGHVLDAQRLAEKNGKQVDIWDENVETFILNLTYPDFYNDDVVKYGYVRGIEPFTYVKQIFERYEHYKAFIQEE